MIPRLARRRLLRRASVPVAGLGLLLAIVALGSVLLLVQSPARLAHSSGAGRVTARVASPEQDHEEALAGGRRLQEGAPRSRGAAAVLNISYDYDEAGRLTGIDYGNGTVITYTYDAGGNLLSRVVAGASPPATPTAHPQERLRLYLPIAYREE